METKKFIAFADLSKKIAAGPLSLVAEKSKLHLLAHPDSNILIFDFTTSQPAEIDFRGSADAVRKRVEKSLGREIEVQEESEKKAGPGRPKLGVTAKEITLLPQHWSWLNEQPGGASVTLRKLVDASMKKNVSRDAVRRAQEAVYKFLVVTAGDREHFEDALRALYSRDLTKFSRLIASWPKDVRDHANLLAEPIFRS